MNYLPFREAMLEKVRARLKTCTSRTKRYGAPGDRLAIGAPGETVTLEKVEQRLLTWIAAFRYREEGLASPEEFRYIWAEIHPRKGWVPEQVVWVHEFRYEITEER